MRIPQTFAQRVFTIAAIYGVIALLPQYFMESVIAKRYPPAITHPEHFYGFIGVALAWQIVFFIIASDPIRYRLIMIPAVFEKLGFGIAAIVLFLQHRLAVSILAAGIIDLVFASLFVFCFRSTSEGN